MGSDVKYDVKRVPGGVMFHMGHNSKIRHTWDAQPGSRDLPTETA